MAPFDNAWLKRAWKQFSEADAPWFNLSKTARAILIAPVLAVLVSLANLIEAWSTELLINPLIGIAEFGRDLVLTAFWGALGRHSGNPLAVLADGVDDPVFGFIWALRQSWVDILNIVSGLSLPALPVALIFVGALAFLLGRVINSG